MFKVVITGGGWAGCAAAIQSAKSGKDVKVILLERADMLLGTGLAGGLFRNNGRWTAAEEIKAMGAGELIEAMDQNAVHTNIEIPHHKHGSVYRAAIMEPIVYRIVENFGVDILMESRVTDVVKEGGKIKSVVLKSGEEIQGDVFVDTTGTSAVPANCTKYGNGCCMCVLRCPSFGPRVSITAKAGAKELIGRNATGKIGALSGALEIPKETVSADIVKKLEEKGSLLIPVVDKKLLEEDKARLEIKACQQYATKEFAENMVFIDNGYVKLITPFLPLHELRQVTGFENAQYEDPRVGSRGNSVRYIGICVREDNLKVIGIDNVFCAGEKCGLLVGHTEAIVTGVLAGYNAVKYVRGEEALVLPRETAIGDMIAYSGEQVKTEEGLSKRTTFAGEVFFERMKNKGLYTIDKEVIEERIKSLGLVNVFK